MKTVDPQPDIAAQLENTDDYPQTAVVGRLVIDRMDELLVLVKQVEDFMLTPAFVGKFGSQST